MMIIIRRIPWKSNWLQNIENWWLQISLVCTCGSLESLSEVSSAWQLAGARQKRQSIVLSSVNSASALNSQCEEDLDRLPIGIFSCLLPPSECAFEELSHLFPVIPSTELDQPTAYGRINLAEVSGKANDDGIYIIRCHCHDLQINMFWKVGGNNPLYILSPSIDNDD